MDHTVQFLNSMQLLNALLRFFQQLDGVLREVELVYAEKVFVSFRVVGKRLQRHGILWGQLYKNRSSRKIDSKRPFSLTEIQFSGKTYFYTLRPCTHSGAGSGLHSLYASPA